MKCTTKIDGAAQKVLSRGLFGCIISAFALGVLLICMWGLLWAIKGEYDIKLLIVAFAPILFGIIILVFYIRLIKNADGEKAYNTYDFGERVVNVRAVRRGVFAGAVDLDYACIRKVKRHGCFLLLYVKGMGAFIVDTCELGDENTRKLMDCISAARG